MIALLIIILYTTMFKETVDYKRTIKDTNKDMFNNWILYVEDLENFTASEINKFALSGRYK